MPAYPRSGGPDSNVFQVSSKSKRRSSDFYVEYPVQACTFKKWGPESTDSASLDQLRDWCRYPFSRRLAEILALPEYIFVAACPT